MKKIKFETMIDILLSEEKIIIQAKDENDNLHIVDSVDIYADKISCIDGWSCYFEAFTNGSCSLYVVK